MDVVAEGANDTSDVACVDKVESPDFSFLPNSLTGQCRSLIESYHELHGYACLPDILWKARLGPFIEAHRELRHLLREVSTTRSAKKSNEGFVRIATLLMSLEILASSHQPGEAGLDRLSKPELAHEKIAPFRHRAEQEPRHHRRGGHDHPLLRRGVHL
jgi:hypothetical protein